MEQDGETYTGHLCAVIVADFDALFADRPAAPQVIDQQFDGSGAALYSRCFQIGKIRAFLIDNQTSRIANIHVVAHRIGPCTKADIAFLTALPTKYLLPQSPR